MVLHKLAYKSVWVGVVWSCILVFVWLRGEIRVGEWCCDVVASCELQFYTSSQPDKNLSVYLCVNQGGVKTVLPPSEWE